MNDEMFEQLVSDGIDELPDHVLTKLRNVAIVVEHEPSEEQKTMHDLTPGETLFGLYEGIPLSERGVGYSALPDKITIFRKPILDAYSDAADIRSCVANTVWHEVAHHFGMDEAEVEKEELKRGKMT